jgi:hypothetical protein
MSDNETDCLPSVKPEEEPGSDHLEKKRDWVFPIASLVPLISWVVFAFVSGFGAFMVVFGAIALISETFTGVGQGYAIAYGSIIFVVGIVLAIFVFICLKILTIPFKNKVIVLKSGLKIGIGDAVKQQSVGNTPTMKEIVSSAKPYLTAICLFALLIMVGNFILGTDRFVYTAIISLVISGYFLRQVFKKLGSSA